ncbi:hypothetical protein F5Y08DRAFT_327953 [Xylaria arbuscula]|nr:hypothetical protein F5Y08DRAFT_327953 [Xylaria arbuscula]
MKVPGETPSPSSHPSGLGHEHDRNTVHHHNHHNHKTDEAMGTLHQPRWRNSLSFLPLHRRITSLRSLTVFAIAAFTISLLLFECNREIGDTALDVIGHSFPGFTEPHVSNVTTPKVPGQCTTWPVPAKGRYKSKVHKPKLAPQSFAPPGGWKKPKGLAVKAMIFFGRKRTIDLLDCYLQQNLVVNGGYLDEVWFMIHTDIEEDLSYLNELVMKRPQYWLVNPGECKGFDFTCMWNPVVEDDTIYIKIDDDIIFIHPDAIPQLVATRIAEPQPFAVSANLVNSPGGTGYKHYDVGAIYPFLPDPDDKPSQKAAQLWRPSDFRTYPKEKMPQIGGNDTHHDINETVAGKYLEGGPHYEGYPWLLLEDTEDALLKTPMGVAKLASLVSTNDNYLRSTAWTSWMIAAQQEYSLLRNLEQNTMWRYHFGAQMDYPQGANSSADPAALKFFDPNHLGPGAEQLYDTQYIRYNLNFVALWGHDIKNILPIGGDDEQEITSNIPKRLQRPFVVDTRAVVSHLSFWPQHEGIRKTDLLDRWRAVANELVCAVDDQKIPFDPRCPDY